MGLDMYAFITRTPVSPVDFKAPEDSQEIAYWHTHPDLHGCKPVLPMTRRRPLAVRGLVAGINQPQAKRS